MKTKYATARSVMGFVLIVGWVTFGVGLLIAGAGLTSGSQVGVLGVGAGIAAAAGGLIQVAMAQVSIAILDMADNSRESLMLQQAVAQKSGVEISEKLAPKAEAIIENSFSKKQPKRDDGVTVYLGEEIKKEGNRYLWNGESYLTLGKAKGAIKSASV